jgi:hypothetical protein
VCASPGVGGMTAVAARATGSLPSHVAIRLIHRRGSLGAMRSRLLDVVLIAGLVVVAGGIMWTLFNLGTTSQPATTPATPAAPTAQPAAPAGPTVSPMAPNTVVVPPGEPTETDAGAPEAVDAPPATADTDAPPAGPPPPRAVPPGTVALERVGFSFATGGTGACGVVLEPWRHVAVSRDLLAAYGCGAEVVVTLDDPAGGRDEMVGVIGDTMNPSFELTVNVYVAEDEPAFQYGLTTGTFTPR